MDWFDQENGDEQKGQEHPLVALARVISVAYIVLIVAAAAQGRTISSSRPPACRNISVSSFVLCRKDLRWITGR